MSTPPLNPLVSKIRSAYPGVYDDMDDAKLTDAVLRKYPQYSDLAAPTGPQGQVGNIRPPQTNMQPMAGSESLITPAHGAGSLGPGQPEATPGMGTAGALGVGLGAAAAYPPTLPFLARAGKAVFPAIKTAAKTGAGVAATEAVVQGAKKLPFLGQYVSKIPGIDYLPAIIGMASGGSKETPEELPTPSTDQVPGRPYQPNPRYAAPPEPEPLPARSGPLLLNGEVQPPPKPSFLKSQLQGQIEQGLGNQPTQIQPGVPIRQQPTPTGPMPTENIPAGHTPVESSALKSYRYDPAAKEFHVATKSGGTYIYGDVPPEQAEAFGQAQSKGQAFQQIKANNPLVGKVVNGKRIAVKPVDQGNDLTDILTRSLQQAQSKP